MEIFSLVLIFFLRLSFTLKKIVRWNNYYYGIWENNIISLEEIINMMKVTKKTDPLFRPLKKFKSFRCTYLRIKNIGYDKISIEETQNIVVFHFGLGNEIDLNFIREIESLGDKRFKIWPNHNKWLFCRRWNSSSFWYSFSFWRNLCGNKHAFRDCDGV